MSLFKLNSPNPNLPRNGFDLSSRRVFSAPVGALLPVGVWECNPGEHFSFNVQDLVRTQPLNTAAFARLKEYYHFFFVPYKALWSGFDKFITGVTNGDNSPVGPISRVGSVSGVGGDIAVNGAIKTANAVRREIPSFKLQSLYTKLTDASSGKDALGYSYSQGSMRLLNLLEYGINVRGSVLRKNHHSEDGHILLDEQKLYSQPYSLDYSVSPFRLMAYQRIYNDFYRNDIWESANPLSFNMDYVFDDSVKLDMDVVKSFCQLRYRHHSKDWLTSSYPTLNYSSSIFRLPSDIDNLAAAEGLEIVDDRGGSLFNDHSDQFGISANDIRSVFALEKMLEATRRANGLDYSNQIAAHYGFKVPESRRPCSHFIGGFDNAISISEVVSTSNGSIDGKLDTATFTGDVKGKGVGALSNGHLSLDVKEHGLIMCIYSAAPQIDYNASHLSAFNRKLTREDFFQPEFQNLGFQPLYGFDINVVSSDSSESAAMEDDVSFNNSIVGFVPRYQEYKTARDLIFGEFQTGLSMSSWVSPRIDIGRSFKKDVTNDKGYPKITPATLLVDPAILNPLFAVQYDGSPLTDQLLVNSYFDVKAVRPMSVSGTIL